METMNKSIIKPRPSMISLQSSQIGESPLKKSYSKGYLEYQRSRGIGGVNQNDEPAADLDLTQNMLPVLPPDANDNQKTRYLS